MKVLFVQYEANMWGTSKSLLTIIDGLLAQGHTAAVCLAQPGSLQDELCRRDVSVEVVPQYPWLISVHTPAWRRATACLKHALVTPSCRALDFCRGFLPDLIHTNTIKTTLGAWLARRTRVPHIWHVRSYPSGRHSLNMSLTWGNRLSQRYMWSRSDHRVFISDSLRRHFRNALDDPQSSVIYNGVCSVDDIAATCAPPETHGFRLLFVGRIDAFKDPFIAVQAIAALKRHGLHGSLRIVGTGAEDMLARLTSCIKEYDVSDRVDFVGYLNDPFQALREADVLVMPSRYDAFGRVIAEAMAAGTVPIVADSPVNHELICHGTDGLIFSPHTPEALAQQILHLVQDREQYRKLAMNAIQKARSQFTTERYVAYLLNLYEAVRSKAA
ncbi:MAG: glycosyltransferase family 4 protein [Candidatus Tectomicrobia bacterium]|nr:glycosyltransferase family 4 protein [Candidatus Tectomicrobia bacterium]